MGDINMNLNPKVPVLLQFENKTEINVRYMVIDPYVSIHIYWNAKSGEIIYDVEEPIISEEEKTNLDRIEQAMREVINTTMVGNDKTKEGLIDYIDKTARLIISELGLKIEENSYKKIFYYLYVKKYKNVNIYKSIKSLEY